MPSCVVCYFLDVDQIIVGVLRMYSNLIVVVYYEMVVVDIVNQGLWEKLREKLMGIFDLKKVLKEGKMFLVKLIVLYQMKRQLGRLLYSVHLGCRYALPNMEDVLWLLGD